MPLFHGLPHMHVCCCFSFLWLHQHFSSLEHAAQMEPGIQAITIFDTAVCHLHNCNGSVRALLRVVCI